MNRNAGAFPGSVKSFNNGLLVIKDDPAVLVGGDAPHRIVCGRQDRDGFVSWVNAKICLAELTYIRQFFH